jgi:VCBS repeat-containing protein
LKNINNATLTSTAATANANYLVSAGTTAAPVVTGISQDTGTNTADGITHDNTLTFSGTALGGATVELFINGVSKGTTLANNLRAWTFDHTGTVLADGVYSVTAKQTDLALNPQSAASSAFQVTVDRNDNAPVFTSGATDTVPENAAISTVIYTATSTDADLTANNRLVTYSLKATGDVALLDISSSGVVTLKASANYEAKTSYSFTVVATNVGTDATQTTEKEVTVNVTNVNEAPTVSAALTSAALEGAAPYTLNLLQGASDVDAGDTATLALQTLTYKVAGVATGNAGTDLPAGLTLSGNTLSVDPTNPAFDNLAAGATRLIEVSYQVKDTGGLTVNQTATITITGTNDAPTLTAFAAVIGTVNEDTQATITLADLKAQGNEADADGTVDAFVIKAVTTGTLRIGTTEANATAWVLGTNDTVDATKNAYWTAAANANG